MRGLANRVHCVVKLVVAHHDIEACLRYQIQRVGRAPERRRLSELSPITSNGFDARPQNPDVFQRVQHLFQTSRPNINLKALHIPDFTCGPALTSSLTSLGYRLNVNAIKIAALAAACVALVWSIAKEASVFVIGLHALVAALIAAQFVRWPKPAAGSLPTETLRRMAVRSRDELARLADGMESVVLEITPSGNIVYSNEVADRFFQSADLVGQSVEQALREPSLVRFIAELPASAAPTDAPLVTEFNLVEPKERTVVARAWLDPTHNETYFLVLRDITELRRLERVRRDFVANVSHELRTPMATIRAMAETLQEEDDRELHHRYLERITREVDRLTNITNDLLTLSVAESQEQPKAPLDLTTVVESVGMQLKTKATQKGLSLTLSLPENCPLTGNESQLTQVAFNLIDNALNYTVEGGVTVTLEQSPSETLLIVRDTGPGIPAEHLPRIFERFYRIDKGRSRNTGGTGLGLSIVRNIVESHGGRVTVNSEMGTGSTFIVALPVQTTG